MSQWMDESRKFYTEFLGFDVAMDMGWVLTFASPQNPTAQITVMQRNEKATPQPNMSIEVEDVDSVHAKALELGLPIVYPITNEPWGVRRFFVADPDVSHPEQIAQMFRKVHGEFGKLDIFVSNARPDLPGFYRRPLDIALEQWQMALDSQARAFLLGAQESSRVMPDGGRILAITYSPGGRTGSWQPWVAMGAAKAALDSLVRYFAVSLAPRRITVNAISPGGVFGPPNVVEGGVLRVLPAEIQEAIRVWHEGGWTPMGRLGTPEDVGNAVMLLCMDEASFITGQILHVDGGGSIMDTVFPLDIQRG
jgi:enoyl-[acyl-carrier protein] reductase III